MNKNKLNELKVYAEGIRARLSSVTPDKHKNSPETYREFWERELVKTTTKMENLKLEGTK